MTKNQFLVFAGDTYYPDKWNDFVGSFPTEKHAFSCAERLTNCDWIQVVDLESESVIKEIRRDISAKARKGS